MREEERKGGTKIVRWDGIEIERQIGFLYGRPLVRGWNSQLRTWWIGPHVVVTQGKGGRGHKRFRNQVLMFLWIACNLITGQGQHRNKNVFESTSSSRIGGSFVGTLERSRLEVLTKVVEELAPGEVDIGDSSSVSLDRLESDDPDRLKNFFWGDLSRSRYFLLVSIWSNRSDTETKLDSCCWFRWAAILDSTILHQQKDI